MASVVEDGLRLTVRVTPRASRSAFAGVAALPDGREALAVRVAAPPVDGAANDALVAFLCKALSVGRGSVAIAAGEASRIKVVRITGDGPAIARQLEAAVSAVAAKAPRAPSPPAASRPK